MSQKIKVVSWDVYGTLVATPNDKTQDLGDLGETPLRAREYALEVLGEIKSRGIIQCTSSDGDIKNLRSCFAEAGIDRGYFADLFKMMWGWPKDYSVIIEDFEISPKELLVVGNNYDIDIKPAIEQGARAIWVPEEPVRGKQRDLRRVLDFLGEYK